MVRLQEKDMLWYPVVPTLVVRPSLSRHEVHGKVQGTEGGGGDGGNLLQQRMKFMERCQALRGGTGGAEEEGRGWGSSDADP